MFLYRARRQSPRQRLFRRQQTRGFGLIELRVGRRFGITKSLRPKFSARRNRPIYRLIEMTEIAGVRNLFFDGQRRIRNADFVSSHKTPAPVNNLRLMTARAVARFGIERMFRVFDDCRVVGKLRVTFDTALIVRFTGNGKIIGGV